jgi:uncharacterized membrane protein
MHDEEAIFEAVAAEGADVTSAGLDGYSFAIAFKGVLLEGLEVAFIVLTFGQPGRCRPAAAMVRDLRRERPLVPAGAAR